MTVKPETSFWKTVKIYLESGDYLVNYGPREGGRKAF